MDYAGRIRATGRSIGVSGLEIKELDPPKGPSGPARRSAEATMLMEATAGAARRVALDERGANLSSEELSERIGGWRDGGAGAVAFFIGGADGLCPSLSDRIDLQLAFGRATWPHLLVRAMLCEQLYRSVSILAGHPYHRA